MTNFYTNFQVDEILGHFLTGIMDLHHDIFFFLILIFVFVSWILVRVVWIKNYFFEPLVLKFSMSTIHFLFILIYFLFGIMTHNVALCMGDPGTLFLEISDSISQDQIWNELDRENLLHRIKEVFQAHENIETLIRELRAQERMRIPGGFQLERVVEMLEDTYGAENMVYIKQDIQEKGINSVFYKETKEYFYIFRREGVTDSLLRKEWQGRA